VTRFRGADQGRGLGRLAAGEAEKKKTCSLRNEYILAWLTGTVFRKTIDRELVHVGLEADARCCLFADH